MHNSEKSKLLWRPATYRVEQPHVHNQSFLGETLVQKATPHRLHAQHIPSAPSSNGRTKIISNAMFRIPSAAGCGLVHNRGGVSSCRVAAYAVLLC